MDGLLFQTSVPALRSDPARADIACFVGFVSPRETAAAQRPRLERALRDLGWNGSALPDEGRVLPARVLPGGETTAAFASWLRSVGWLPQPGAVDDVELFRRAAGALLGEALVAWWNENAWLTPFSDRSCADLLELADVPVPIDTWDAFLQLFALDRPLDDTGRLSDTTLGAAVHRFFLYGGRRCYVVRIGDPWPLFAPPSRRVTARARVLRVLPPPVPSDRTTWRGLAHLFGLPDVSFAAVPDLPDLFAAEIGIVAPETEGEEEERFIECATRTAPPTSRSLRAFPPPRSDETGFRDWAELVARAGSLLERHCREVQLVAAVPLPADEVLLRTHPDVIALPRGDRPRVLAARAFASHRAQWEAAGSIQTAFVQLAYPWLQTRQSLRLPGAVEPPDAMLVGLLAGNALTVGTWRSVARTPLSGIVALTPALDSSDLERALPYHSDAARLRTPRTLRERVSILAPTATGFQLLSDVTTDDDEAYRPANVNRLVSAIVRAARLAGETAVFANNGEPVWRQLRAGIEELLLGLWGEGALDGAAPADAFDVRCDRSTMTQADLDNGRVIVRLQFTAARPIERIVVVLALDDGGQVTLLPDGSGGLSGAVA